MQIVQAAVGLSPLPWAARTRMGAAQAPGRRGPLQGHLPAIARLPPQLRGASQQPARVARLLAAPCRASGGGEAGVPVRFTLQRKLKFGETHRIVGNHPALGSWEVGNAPGMAWEEDHMWTFEAVLPPGTELEFKCVRVKGEGGKDARWEDGHNRTLRVPDSGAAAVSVSLEWGGEMSVEVQPGEPIAAGVPAAAMAAAAPGAGQQRGGSREERKQQRRREKDGKAGHGGEDATAASPNGAATNGAVNGAVNGRVDDSMSALPQWQGRELRFMRSNEHTRDRQGVWDTSGLQGPALHLVSGDRDAPNWLSKLEVLKRLLVDDAPELRPNLDAVAHAYIYMQWLTTGAIACVEGGGHHRPNRHAELARLMFRSLEWVIGEQGRSSPAAALVGRRLQSRLPSFTDQFTQSTPLTRIRDIAHRNDIPSELKAEIKHTLQNKLHRNAGPEDLHTTEAMLARITAEPGQYPGAFIQEFRTFTAELRDFFNAGSFSDMLDSLKPSLDSAPAQLLEHFGGAKARLDAAGEQADQNTIMDVLHAATSVRALLASGLASGLRNDAPDRALAMRQKWRQCEVRAEDYAFVLLSRFGNKLEERGGAAAIAGGSDGGWALPIGALVLGLRHMGLSGYNPKECLAVEQELAAWQKAGGFKERENALRLRASLQRLRRLTEGYSQLVLDAYAERAEVMGRALGLDQQQYQVFSESEIRASPAFQLSKLASMLIKATTITTGGSPWDVVMAGEAQGLLLKVDALQPGCLDAAKGQDAILLVASATGDEEVAALGSNVKGIILQQDLPHLSHLGVRARQERVPFVTCEDAEAVAAATGPLMGSSVHLVAAADGVTLQPAGAGSSGAAAAPSLANGNGSTANGNGVKPAAGAVQRVSSVQVVPLSEATLDTAGAKAAACGELLRLAAAAAEGGAAAVLAAPDGVVLPFGCMEAAVAADGKKEQLQELMRKLDGSLAQLNGGDGGSKGGSGAGLAALDAVCGEIQGLLEGLAIPQQALQQVGSAFKSGGSTVIVRSSANVEDLAGMSGAGLYESIPNIDSGNPGALRAAVAGVWASLFSRRAVLSRHAAGVPQGSACMAVVVQRQLSPDLCFVLHTRHPVSGDANMLSAELAPGLGETLAAGTRGTAWRLEADKQTSTVSTTAFANFSQALLPPGSTATVNSSGGGAVYAPSGAAAAAAEAGGKGGAAVTQAPAPAAAKGVRSQVVDYSRQPMSVSPDVRSSVGQRLLAVAALLEHEFGEAQDVEGCFVGNNLYVVQTRPQP